MNQDVLGQAILDYYQKKSSAKLWIHNKYGPKEEMPVDVYFRDEHDMSELDLIAISNCQGNVLDIGAGAGSHALLLQEKCINVTALEISPLAVQVIKNRGVKQVLEEDIFKYCTQQFDTLLLLMNGIGLTETVNGLRQFLQHSKKLLCKSGQLIFDSSDVAYLYEGNLPAGKDYYGEISYQYEYKRQKTGWFKWLYIDKILLSQIAAEEGWNATIIAEDKYDQYVAKLLIK